MTVQQVPYVGPVPDPTPEITYDDQSLPTSVEKFLSTSAIRPTDDSVEGLDYSSTNAEGAGHGFQPLDEERYGDTAKLIFDTVDEWAAERFV